MSIIKLLRVTVIFIDAEQAWMAKKKKTYVCYDNQNYKKKKKEQKDLEYFRYLIMNNT